MSSTRINKIGTSVSATVTESQSDDKKETIPGSAPVVTLAQKIIASPSRYPFFKVTEAYYKRAGAYSKSTECDYNLLHQYILQAMLYDTDRLFCQDEYTMRGFLQLSIKCDEALQPELDLYLESQKHLFPTHYEEIKDCNKILKENKDTPTSTLYRRRSHAYAAVGKIQNAYRDATIAIWIAEREVESTLQLFELLYYRKFLCLNLNQPQVAFEDHRRQIHGLQNYSIQQLNTMGWLSTVVPDSSLYFFLPGELSYRQIHFLLDLQFYSVCAQRFQSITILDDKFYYACQVAEAFTKIVSDQSINFVTDSTIQFIFDKYAQNAFIQESKNLEDRHKQEQLIKNKIDLLDIFTQSLQLKLKDKLILESIAFKKMLLAAYENVKKYREEKNPLSIADSYEQVIKNLSNEIVYGLNTEIIELSRAVEAYFLTAMRSDKQGNLARVIDKDRLLEILTRCRTSQEPNPTKCLAGLRKDIADPLRNILSHTVVYIKTDGVSTVYAMRAFTYGAINAIQLSYNNLIIATWLAGIEAQHLPSLHFLELSSRKKQLALLLNQVDVDEHKEQLDYLEHFTDEDLRTINWSGIYPAGFQPNFNDQSRSTKKVLIEFLNHNFSYYSIDINKPLREKKLILSRKLLHQEFTKANDAAQTMDFALFSKLQAKINKIILDANMCELMYDKQELDKVLLIIERRLHLIKICDEISQLANANPDTVSMSSEQADLINFAKSITHPEVCASVVADTDLENSYYKMESLAQYLKKQMILQKLYDDNKALIQQSISDGDNAHQAKQYYPASQAYQKALRILNDCQHDDLSSYFLLTIRAKLDSLNKFLNVTEAGKITSTSSSSNSTFSRMSIISKKEDLDGTIKNTIEKSLQNLIKKIETLITEVQHNFETSPDIRHKQLQKIEDRKETLTTKMLEISNVNYIDELAGDFKKLEANLKLLQRTLATHKKLYVGQQAKAKQQKLAKRKKRLVEPSNLISKNSLDGVEIRFGSEPSTLDSVAQTDEDLAISISLLLMNDDLPSPLLSPDNSIHKKDAVDNEEIADELLSLPVTDSSLLAMSTLSLSSATSSAVLSSSEASPVTQGNFVTASDDKYSRSHAMPEISLPMEVVDQLTSQLISVSIVDNQDNLIELTNELLPFKIDYDPLTVSFVKHEDNIVFLKNIISEQKKNNHLPILTFIFGGLPRDVYGNLKAPNDTDILTNATAEEIFAAFRITDQELKNKCTITESYGVRFNLPSAYTNGLRVDIIQSMHLCNNALTVLERLTAYAQSCDFTINTLLLDSNKNLYSAIKDKVKADFNSRTIATVVDPAVSFANDSRRILTAIYFVSTLNFVLANNIVDLLNTYKQNPLAISRIEFPTHDAKAVNKLSMCMKDLFTRHHAAENLEQLCRFGLLPKIFPEVKSKYLDWILLMLKETDTRIAWPSFNNICMLFAIASVTNIQNAEEVIIAEVCQTKNLLLKTMIDYCQSTERLKKEFQRTLGTIISHLKKYDSLLLDALIKFKAELNHTYADTSSTHLQPSVVQRVQPVLTGPVNLVSTQLRSASSAPEHKVSNPHRGFTRVHQRKRRTVNPNFTNFGTHNSPLVMNQQRGNWVSHAVPESDPKFSTMNSLPGSLYAMSGLSTIPVNFVNSSSFSSEQLRAIEYTQQRQAYYHSELINQQNSLSPFSPVNAAATFMMNEQIAAFQRQLYVNNAGGSSTAGAYPIPLAQGVYNPLALGNFSLQPPWHYAYSREQAPSTNQFVIPLQANNASSFYPVSQTSVPVVAQGSSFIHPSGFQVDMQGANHSRFFQPQPHPNNRRVSGGFDEMNHPRTGGGGFGRY